MITKNERILVIDTETANTIQQGNGPPDMSDVLVYDCGWIVTTREGEEIERASFINYDIYRQEWDLMQSAYYANKIPQYESDIVAGRRKLVSLKTIIVELNKTIARNQITYIAAYNARFDQNALNRTISWVTKSVHRYAFPFGKVIWLDIMKMAQDAICSTKAYQEWATDRDFVQKNGVPRKSAEMVYRFITGDDDFKEFHTGLEDVEIEVFIMMHCFSEAKRRHCKMRVLLWENPKEFPESTPFQIALMASLKKNPTINMGRY